MSSAAAIRPRGRTHEGTLARMGSLVLVVSLLASLSLPAQAGEHGPASHDAERRFGVATASNGWDPSELDDVAQLVGASPSIVLHYLGFVDELHNEQLEAVADAGAVSLLTWEPFDWEGNILDQDFALRRILAGDFDEYLARTARTLRAFDEPVLLRFAHEMNGDWYPWSEQRNGNRAGEYVAVWRHIHDLFTDLGVDNVTWVWSPNVEYPGSQPLAELYPGAEYVDAVALDGYNWGSTDGYTTGWQSPAEVFDPTLEIVRDLAPGLPVMIGETGSTDAGGDKVAWIEDLFPWLVARDIDTLVWFHLDKETDWRIDSSPGTSEAFASALGAWLSGEPADDAKEAPPGDDDLPADPPGDDKEDGGEGHEDGAGPDDGALVILTPSDGERIGGDLRVTGRVAEGFHRVDVQVAGAGQKMRPDGEGRWEVVFAQGTLASGSHELTVEARGRRGLRETVRLQVEIADDGSMAQGDRTRKGNRA